MIIIRSNHRAMERELRRLENMPDPATVRRLDAVLAKGLRSVQAKIHVNTGALKATAEKDSSVNEATDEWKGSIGVGDEARGVDYAIYEATREPDEHGDHDFMRELPALDPLYVQAILKGLAP